MSHDTGGLETVETTNQSTGSCTVVEVYHAHRHLLRHTLVEQRGKEEHRQQREYHHTAQVDRILYQNLHLALGDPPDI
jgi:hypothetical protein